MFATRKAVVIQLAFIPSSFRRRSSRHRHVDARIAFDRPAVESQTFNEFNESLGDTTISSRLVLLLLSHTHTRIAHIDVLKIYFANNASLNTCG